MGPPNYCTFTKDTGKKWKIKTQVKNGKLLKDIAKDTEVNSKIN